MNSKNTNTKNSKFYQNSINSQIGSEKYSVQQPIINYVSESSAVYTAINGRSIFINLGWNYVSPKEALKLRGDESSLVFRDIFQNQLYKLNNFLTSDLISEIVSKIERIPPSIEGNLIAWEYLKGIRTVFVPSEKRERNVKFLDTENIKNNTFHVTDEFIFTIGGKTIRLDLVFLINGIPLIMVETKACHKVDMLYEAIEQVKKYHSDCPELFALMQIYSITNLIKYYYSSTWNTSTKLLINYKDEIQGNFEKLVKSFFDKKHIVSLLSDFIIFTRQDDELKKVILRPHQVRAVQKIIERAASDKKRGLIWHTQGSGKTYTMIVAAQKIMENPLFENPTVIMLVDRNELESQLFGNIRSVGIESVTVAESKKHLEELLKNDKRGLIVSMIHKFEGIPAKLNTRKNIFVLIDEAHRTTGGKLGNYLMGALPNATFIGFTGTPIDKTSYGKGTFTIFGKDDSPKGYLDKYSISESIEDGATVQLHYSLASNDLMIDREILEKEFLDLKESSGISDIETLNKILDKAVNLKNMLKSRDRVKKVAEFVAEHYKNNVEPMGYKAFLVAVDREACALYKEELDKLLPSEYSNVVYSSNNSDPPLLRKYHLSEEEEKRIRKAFRNPKEYPKILIVTEKLLTGFDAPILYCMYLDKPMRDHILLQAIARVNRPYEDHKGVKKYCGLVIDFVGIFDNLEKALAFDSSDIEGVIRDLNELKKKFANIMQKARKQYLSKINGLSEDKAVERILECFINESVREEYYKLFKELYDIYEVLSPDAFLRDYLDDYNALAKIYRIVKEAFERKVSIDIDFAHKTAELISKHTKTTAIKPSLEIYEISEKGLKEIEKSKASDIEKIFNIVNSIKHEMKMKSEIAPFLKSIAEKAERIINLFINKQKTTQQTLQELKKLISEMSSANTEMHKNQMSPETYTVYCIIKERGLNEPVKIAREVEKAFKKYPHWQTSSSHKANLLQELYPIIINYADCSTTLAKEIVDEIITKLKGE